MSRKIDNLWESSRMILPEHKARLIQQLEEDRAANKPKRRVMDDEELQELANQLAQAKDDGQDRALTVWGMEEPVRCRIVALDARTRLVHVERWGRVSKVAFMDVMGIGLD